MCFRSGGGGGSSGAPTQQWMQNSKTGEWALVDLGIPQDYFDRGAKSVSQYQIMAQQDLSDKQIAAQKDIADKQSQFNQQQFDYQKQQADKQQQDVTNAAARQTEYDAGRANLLDQGTKQIDTAFAQFSPDYFNKYASDYMSKVGDQVNQQKVEAQKQIGFGLSRQGLSDSQASANQQGLLAETEGRTLADETANAQNQANQLRSNVANAKQNLLGQVTNSESIGSPIAATDEPGIQSQLQTQRQAISGITNSAGDVTASLQGVPTVSPLSNIFANVIGSAGSYLGGIQANQIYGQGQRGLAGMNSGTGKN